MSGIRSHFMKIIFKKKKTHANKKMVNSCFCFLAGDDDPCLTYHLNCFISGSVVNSVSSIRPPGQADKDIQCQVAQEEEEMPFHYNLRQTINIIRWTGGSKEHSVFFEIGTLSKVLLYVAVLPSVRPACWKPGSNSCSNSAVRSSALLEEDTTLDENKSDGTATTL